MGKSVSLLLTLLLIQGVVFASESEQKPPVGFLVQTKEIPKAIDLYNAFVKNSSHDFELLQQLALGILHQGAMSQDPEEQLLSIFGASIAHTALPFGLMNECLTKDNPQNQLACLQLLGQLQDDRCDEILNKAMSSPFFITRVEAANLLATRKAKSATGQIEGLMYKIPEEFRYLFAEFFARIGTPDAISILKQLMSDRFCHNRAAGMLAAAYYQRDDLLPTIRSHLTHHNSAEQEACATALGLLKDSKSINRLKRLAEKSTDTTRLAALRSLYSLGLKEVKTEIFELAQKKNLFAIALLGEIEGAEEVLIPLAHDGNSSVKFNATLSLLQLKRKEAIAPLIGFLLKDAKDLGFIPTSSVGGSLRAYKVVASTMQRDQIDNFDIIGFSHYLREQLLHESIELEESDFLSLITTVLNSGQKGLVPLATSLLAKRGTPPCLALLETYSEMTGAPLVRAYCSLTLYKKNSSSHHLQKVRQWLENQKGKELIRLLPPVLSKDKPLYKTFELSPEESSRLLVECCMALAEKHDDKSISLILSLIKEGNPKNRPILAAVLLNALN